MAIFIVVICSEQAQLASNLYVDITGEFRCLRSIGPCLSLGRLGTMMPMPLYQEQSAYIGKKWPNSGNGELSLRKCELDGKSFENSCVLSVQFSERLL